MKTKGVIYCGLFTALIAVGAFIKIPIPVVPFTLQYLFTMLAGLLLGSRLGTVSVLSYMHCGTYGKKDHCTVPSGKSGRTVLCLCSRYDLLLYHL